MLLKMALLSALKRPKRAVLIIMAIALSVFVMEFVSGWVEGIRDRMSRKIVEETAHILVERQARVDALDPLEPKNYIEDADAVAGTLRTNSLVSRVEEVTPFGALVMNESKNLPLKVYGIEGDTGFFTQVGRGRISGSFPFKGPALAISEKALGLIGASRATSLVVLVEDSFGAPAYKELPIACVFRTDDSEFDASTAFVDLSTATDLLGTKGAAELWLKLADPNRADAVAKAMLPYLTKEGCVTKTWSQLQGSLLVLIKFMDMFMLMINVIVLIVAATVITNAILMNVFEKQKEYGTLRAIGMKRRQQALLVLLEGAGQGVVGAILGALLAFPLVLFFSIHGLPIGEASHIFGGGDVMYFGTNFISTLRNIGIGALIAIIGSLYAAFAGTRSSVVEALRNG